MSAPAVTVGFAGTASGGACSAPTVSAPRPAAPTPLVDGLPLTLDLAGREVLVVGAGPVSARRVRTFLEAGARVTVVAPQIGAEMAELVVGATEPVPAGALTVHLRRVVETDLDSPWLVHTATGDPRVDAEVAASCRRRRLWCVTAGDAGVGTARVPARTAVRTPTGAVRIAVDSGDPGRSVRVGRQLARSLATAPRGLRGRRRGATGWVALVGSGPERDLLTVRAQRLIHAADVLVVDGALDAELRAELDEDVEVVELHGIGHPRHAAAIVVDRRRRGLGVVRLVCPNGLAAEAEKLDAAGVDCDLVPGVLPS